MIQILIIFYGPGLLFDLPLLPRFGAALLSFVINYACYFSEIYRGGIQSIPRGQYEAGEVLGMTRSQIFFKVTLLQVVKRIVPPMGNEFITLVKDTALVRVISVYEIIWMGESYIKKGMIWPLFYTAVFYLAVNGILTLLFRWAEKKLDYFPLRRGTPWPFWKSRTSKSTLALPGCWRTSALSWNRARPWPSSARRGRARPPCCAA